MSEVGMSEHRRGASPKERGEYAMSARAKSGEIA
jgi:hypothetical protein